MSRFQKIYNMIFEQLAPAQDAKIEAATEDYVEDLKEDPVLNDLIGSDDAGNKNVLKNVVKKNVKKTIDYAFTQNLKTYLKSRNLDFNLFDVNFMQNYYDDVYAFLSFVNSNGEDAMLELKDYQTDIVDVIANFYKISPEFVRAVMYFSYQEKSVGVGPGEIGVSFFFKGTMLSPGTGDIYIDGEPTEVKATDGRIPDTMPNPAQCRRAAKAKIAEFVEANQGILKNPKLLDDFNQNSWLSLYVVRNYEKTTYKLLCNQFETVGSAASFKDKAGEPITKADIVKALLIAVFTQYGKIADYIVENIDSLFESSDPNDFRFDILKLREISVASFVQAYQEHENFSKILFYRKGSTGSIYIKDATDYVDLVNFVKFPTFGDKEGGTRPKTVLSAK